MTFGFVPRRDQEHVETRDELTVATERWQAWQLSEALALNMMLSAAHDALLKQVRRYARQLAKLDPDNHNAAQDVGKIVLALSYAETVQQRLDVLAKQADRLMLAVCEAKRTRRTVMADGPC